MNSTEANDALKKFSALSFHNREEGIHHNPYDQEVREMLSIEEGNLELLQKSLAERYSGTLGVLAENPLRSTKNLCIVVIALASRAAIRGGLSPETAFSLSDSYIQQIECCSSADSAGELLRSAEFNYAKLVRDIRSAFHKKNAIVDNCRNYITTHLHEKITVTDLAEREGISSAYLSELFRKYAHTTIIDYIMKEKINAAKNLLLYSEMELSEIAGYLGFSSQSHFGDKFRKSTGLTPRRFRMLYGVKKE